MKLRVTIKNSNDIKFYSPDSNWTSFIATVRDILEESNDKLTNIMINMSPTIKAAGIVSFEPKIRGDYIIMGEYENDEKWGWQFKIDGGYENVRLESQEDKKLFLEQILTERQVESLYSTFEDPFEYVKNGNVAKLMDAKFIGEHTANRIIDKFKATMDLAPAYNFFKPLGVTPLLINKLCSVYGSAENAIKKFKKNPYILADDIKGVGFLRADEIALKYNIKPDDTFRIKSGVRYLFRDVANNDGSTWLTIEDFNNRIIELLKIHYETIWKTIQEMVKEKEIYYEENNKIALMYYYDLECNIVNKLMSLQKAECKTYTDEEIEEGIKRAEIEQGFEFTDEQTNGIKSLLKNNVSLVVGLAGTGKTSIIKGAYQVFPYDTIIRQCAFSGQAAKRINEATSKPSSTIHRLLGWQGESFTYKESYPLPVDVVILDEVSMVGLELFWSLIQAIPRGAKLIMLGDNGQLPPIGVGNLLNDLMLSQKINFVELTKIHRQAEKSAIITTSQKIRKKFFLFSSDFEGDETYGQLRDLTLKARIDADCLFDVLIETFMEEYNKSKNIQDIQIIVAQNQRVALARDQINREIQKRINPKISDFQPEIKIKYKNVLRVNDKIINRENHYDVETPDGIQTSIYNGSMGIVKEISTNYIIVAFFDEGEIVIPKEYYEGLELAYAITCHSSQGSQFKVTIVGFDNSSYILLSNEWLYTAVTRAKNMCYIVAQTRAINMAVTRHKTVDRNTFLLELFTKYPQK